MTQATSAAAGQRRFSALINPSPFDGDRAGESDVTVTVSDGQLAVTDGERSVWLRPVRAVVGHGTLHVTTTGPRRHLRLRFEREPVPALARQHFDYLRQLYRRLDAIGFRELLVSLRDHGVRLSVTPRARRGAVTHRATAWVGAYALLFVELALFGLPATVIWALLIGAYQTGSAVTTAALVAGFAVFLILAVTTSPLPLFVRHQFAHGTTRDPIKYFDTWAGRSEPTDPGKRATFVPGVPVLHTAILLAACALYALRPGGSLASGELPESPGTGDELVPVPSWLDGELLSLLGYAGMVLLLVLFAVSVVRWRQDRELYGIRWATLVGAFICFAFGQAGSDLSPRTSLEMWLQVVVLVLVVAFTSGRLAIGFGVFTAMIGVTLAAAFGLFTEPSAFWLLLPVLILLGAIAARYFPGGARLVPLAPARAAQVTRLVWTMWAVAVVLGIGLAVAAARLIQLG